MDIVHLPGDLLPNDSPDSPKRQCSIACVAVDLPIFPYHRSYIGSGQLYIPSCGDIVVGLITKVSGDHYKVDVESSFEGILPITSFNHATKQNRPFLDVGALVVTRVVSLFNDVSSFSIEENKTKMKTTSQTSCHTPVLLSCVDSNDSRGWSTGEVYFGEITKAKEGFFFKIPLPLALSLQADDCYILDRLGEFFSFEVAVGLNGRVWVRGNTPVCTVLVAEILKKAYGLRLPEIENLILDGKERFKNLNALLPDAN